MGLLDYLEQARQRMLNTGTGLLNSRAAMDSVMPEVRAQGESEIMNHPGMQWAGLLGTMAGIGAKTADLVKLAAAQKMEKAGTAPEQIWQATGWGRSPGDGQWRFEINDSNSIPLPRTWGEAKDLEQGNSTVTRRQRALAHPELSAAYPETKQLPVRLLPDSAGGSFEDGGAFGPVITVGADKKYNYKANQSTMLHELQHAIQQREGFARGGSPETMALNPEHYSDAIKQAQMKVSVAAEFAGGRLGELARKSNNQGLNWKEAHEFMQLKKTLPEWKQLEQATQEFTKGNSPYELYRRLAGEAEARMTQARMHLTPEERLANYPFQQGLLGYDVPVDQLITRFGNDKGLLQQSVGKDYMTLAKLTDEANLAFKANPTRENLLAFKELLKQRDMAAPKSKNTLLPAAEDYTGLHRPPMRDSGAPLHDLTGGGKVYPDDVYSSNAVRYYGTGEDALDAASIYRAQSFKGKPDARVTIYRAVPKDAGSDINPGDWITINRQYAVNHGESTLLGDYKIVKKTVRAKDIFTNGDSIHEWGYDPQK